MHSLLARLALDASTGAVLVAILLVATGQELWSPFMPAFIDATGRDAGLAGIWIVGLYGCLEDVLECVYYLAGGTISAKLGMRASLLVYHAMPVAGAALVGLWPSPWSPLLAVVFFKGWHALAMPALLTVATARAPADRRIVSIALQELPRRIPRVVGWIAGGFLAARMGEVLGMQIALAAYAGLGLVALGVQARFQAIEGKEPLDASGWRVLLDAPRALRVLWLSEVLVRWCEGLVRVLLVLYALRSMDAARFGLALALIPLINLASYLPSVLSDKPRPRPFVLATFVFFGLFPLAVVLLLPVLGWWGFLLAMIPGGLREIGEPARKALIVSLLPADQRARGAGWYWGTRSAAVCLAPLVGAGLWVGLGPEAPFLAAGVCGLGGAALFAARFTSSSSASP